MLENWVIHQELDSKKKQSRYKETRKGRKFTTRRDSITGKRWKDSTTISQNITLIKYMFFPWMWKGPKEIYRLNNTHKPNLRQICPFYTSSTKPCTLFQGSKESATLNNSTVREKNQYLKRVQRCRKQSLRPTECVTVVIEEEYQPES